MDEKPEQILEYIETQRNKLGANLNELESRVRQTTDWRAHFDQNPMLMLGAALGGGIMLGAIVSSALPRSTESYTGSRHFSPQTARDTGASVQRHRASETMDHVKTALIAFATAKAKEFMSQALPGFENYLRDAESKPGSQQTEYSGYGQQTSGSGQGANYGQNFGTDYGRPSAGQPTYSPEREYVRKS